MASARRRLYAAARRLGAVRRSRRGGHQVRRRRAVHDRRRLAAELLRERARIQRSARRAGRGRLRQQRQPGARGRAGRAARRRAGQPAQRRRPARSPARRPRQRRPRRDPRPSREQPAPGSTGSTVAAQASDAAIPGMPGPATTGGHTRPSGHRARRGHWHAAHATKPRQQANPAPAVAADVPGASVYGPSMAPGPASADSAAIPGLATATKHAQRANDPVPQAPPGAQHRTGIGGQRSAGLHQRGRAGSDGHAAPVRGTGRGDDRAGHRRIRLGAEHASHQ